MSVRDNLKFYDIQDGTTGVHLNNLSNDLFEDYGEQDFKISVGDFLLLRNIKSILLNDHDCFIKIGFKNI